MKCLLYGPSLWARSIINQKFQPEVWNFTVKPVELLCLIFDQITMAQEQKLFIIWLQMGEARQMERTSTWRSFSITKKCSSERIVKQEISVWFKFLLFLTKFLSAKVTKFVWF